MAWASCWIWILIAVKLRGIDWDRAGFAKGVCLSEVRLGVTSGSMCKIEGECRKLIWEKLSWVLPLGKEWDLFPWQLGTFWCTSFSWRPGLVLLSRAKDNLLLSVSVIFSWICLFSGLSVYDQRTPIRGDFLGADHSDWFSKKLSCSTMISQEVIWHKWIRLLTLLLLFTWALLNFSSCWAAVSLHWAASKEFQLQWL